MQNIVVVPRDKYLTVLIAVLSGSLVRHKELVNIKPDIYVMELTWQVQQSTKQADACKKLVLATSHHIPDTIHDTVCLRWLQHGKWNVFISLSIIIAWPNALIGVTAHNLKKRNTIILSIYIPLHLNNLSQSANTSASYMSII